MAETAETAATTETKKIINPRVEIDTSPPFESVKEAVDRFGGSGPWIPHHLLRLAAAHHGSEGFDVEKIEEQAEQLERDLIMKERQTLNVLKELEAAKRFVEGLKFNLMPEMSSFIVSPDLRLQSDAPVPNDKPTEGLSLCPVVSPGLMFTELNQAKLNLNKTSVDLAAIQASVESLNKKLRKDKVLLERRKMQIQNREEGSLSVEGNHRVSLRKPDVDQEVEGTDDHDVSTTLTKEAKQVNFEAEQFKKMTEASRYEVMKAMAEIERTKNCIRMAEMRLNAAKKMEEAAKAVEAIALAERKALLDGESPPDVFVDGITLSFEEYKALSQKAKQAEELCKTKFIDTNGLQRANEADQPEVPILEKFEETTTTKENKQSRQVVSFSEEGPHRANVVIEDSFSSTHVERGRVQRPGNNFSKFKFRNSRAGSRNNPDILNGSESGAVTEKPAPGFRSTASIGDVLSRKFVLQDDVMMGTRVENHSERQHVSLSQMLREQSRLILHPTKTTADGNVEKQFFVQRKKFGFIHVPIPMKQSKKKAQPPNQR